MAGSIYGGHKKGAIPDGLPRLMMMLSLITTYYIYCSDDHAFPMSGRGVARCL